MILENKIEQLLGEKNILETEECPQPMPYVKKYTAQTCINFYPHISPINDNLKNKDNDKEKEEVVNKKEMKIKNNNKKKVHFTNNKKNKKNNSKNKKIINKDSKKLSTLKTSMNLTPKKNGNLLKNNKSISCLRTRNNTDINLKNDLSNKSNHNNTKNKTKKSSWKKINNPLILDNIDSGSKTPFLRHVFFEEENKNNKP